MRASERRVGVTGFWNHKKCKECGGTLSHSPRCSRHDRAVPNSPIRKKPVSEKIADMIEDLTDIFDGD